MLDHFSLVFVCRLFQNYLFQEILSNSLLPDQARHFDLGENCLQRLSTDDTSMDERLTFYQNPENFHPCTSGQKVKDLRKNFECIIVNILLTSSFNIGLRCLKESSH